MPELNASIADAGKIEWTNEDGQKEILKLKKFLMKVAKFAGPEDRILVDPIRGFDRCDDLEH